MATRVSRPYETGRFYRLGAERMSLAPNTSRSGTVGFSASESWAPCSGVFAYRMDLSVRYAGRYSDVYSDTYRRDSTVSAPTAAVASTWQANKSASDADLTSFINGALINAGYTRPDGTPIS